VASNLKVYPPYGVRRAAGGRLALRGSNWGFQTAAAAFITVRWIMGEVGEEWGVPPADFLVVGTIPSFEIEST
jgi:hypothetical protein